MLCKPVSAIISCGLKCYLVSAYFGLEVCAEKRFAAVLVLRGLELNPRGTMTGKELGSMENVQCTSKIPQNPLRALGSYMPYKFENAERMCLYDMEKLHDFFLLSFSIGPCESVSAQRDQVCGSPRKTPSYPEKVCGAWGGHAHFYSTSLFWTGICQYHRLVQLNTSSMGNPNLSQKQYNKSEKIQEVHLGILFKQYWRS